MSAGMEVEGPADSSEVAAVASVQDPREVLASWANQQDEWVRAIVRHILSTGRQLTDDEIHAVYDLFRQEKGLDARTSDAEPELAIVAVEDDAELPLVLTMLSEVTGVNAIVPGSVIEPHAGMTILFGENGTGKTGYSRIFKALAGSRTADTILGDITLSGEVPQSAKIEYAVGTEAKALAWAGEQGVVPFTRMSIFDSPAVNFHVDDELEYVYVPAVLSLFNHVNSAFRAVRVRVDEATRALASDSTLLLSRFPRDSKVYPSIETLGASTDLAWLDALADRDADVDDRIDLLRHAVAGLEANTISVQLSELQRIGRVFRQASTGAAALATLDVQGFNGLLARRAELQQDYRTFRSEMFAAAALPADPEETWDAFVSSGEAYRQHLKTLGVHDSGRCLYCRQQLADPAKELIAKYSEYLTDKISSDLAEAEARIREICGPILDVTTPDVDGFLADHQDQVVRLANYDNVATIHSAIGAAAEGIRAGVRLDAIGLAEAVEAKVGVDAAMAALADQIADLKAQSEDRSEALREKKQELAELVAAAELGKSWANIEAQVESAKEADRLQALGGRFAALGRAVTELAKSASDQLVNQNFEILFAEECTALRAPDLRVEFFGRQGRAQRRKTLGAQHKPSKILSEGEQKVLALADFLAEARLVGITAPVIFDDPVSSLDHRRISEVAQRIASLADKNQVIVFTHDIFFAATLLSLFETSRRCAYFQITDEDGKGKVTRSSGPRWDSLGSLKAHIIRTIEAARGADGDARAALVREGYDWIRSWCEVFTETELLAGVSQRYQPNIRMTTLSSIKTRALPVATEVVTRVFEDACRYIPGHSQPLPALGVAPTLTSLESHWKELQDARKAYLAAD